MTGIERVRNTIPDHRILLIAEPVAGIIDGGIVDDTYFYTVWAVAARVQRMN